ncbi:MAG: cytochrome D1 domain-containing protein [Egibacteraceae bacterium]
MTQALVEHDQARGAIRDAVRRQSARLRAAAPTAVVAALVAAACMPIVWPLLGTAVPESLKGIVALLGSTGGGYISHFIKDAVERLRPQDGEPKSEAEVQQELERALLVRLEADDEGAAGLRADVAALLESVQGVQAALEAASADVRQALAAAFTELGASFHEFGWMLDQASHTLTEIQREQRHQTDLARETLVKINLLMRRQAAATAIAPAPTALAEAVEEEDSLPAPGPPPYMGLAAFQAEDAQWFFGREQLVAELTVRLAEGPSLAVVGPSGSGKSSVLRAGLLPAVWGGMVAGAGSWSTVVLTPGAHPLEELAVRVALVRGVAPGSLLADLRADPGLLRLAVRQAVAEAPGDTRLLLLVDQFEETFTLCDDEAERRQFIQALVALVGDPDSPATVVLGLRADFYDRCADYPGLIDILEDNQALVGPMTAAELRAAITSPAERAGLTLEPGLVETVLADLGEEPGSLPLLSHALFATWQRRRGRTLTRAGYADAGGVRRAIAQTAEAVYSALDPASQAIVKEVFLRLIALGEGTADTRRRVRRSELLADRDAEGVDRLVDRLAEARLLTLGEDSVEIAHEALIREWPALGEWLTEDREGLHTQRRLTQAALEWESLARDRGALYRGVRLATAREWAQSHETRLNDLEREFLTASSNAERDELAAARRRSRLLSALSAVLAILLIVAVQQRQSARQQRDLATSRQLAAQAEGATSSDPQLATLLSVAAFDVADTAEAHSSLLNQRQRLQGVERFLSGHTDPVGDVLFSPDGRLLATGGGEGAVILWDAAQRTRLDTLTGHTDRVSSVAFSPDGRVLATGGGNGEVLLWDVAQRTQLDTLTGHTSVVVSIAFSPDGRTLAAAGADGTVIIWDMARTAPALTVRVGEAVTSAAFSADGRVLATGAGNGEVVLWDVTQRAQLATLTGHTSAVNSAAFSADGRTLATGDVGGGVILWDVAQRTQLDTLTGHTDRVSSVGFSADGRILATGGGNGEVLLWDVAQRARLDTLTGHTDRVLSVAFSPDGRTLATGGGNGEAILWDVAQRTPPAALTGLIGPVSDTVFSPDGRLLALAGFDGEIVLWDTAQPTQRATLLGDAGEEGSGMAFSPDGRLLASGSDSSVVLWDVVRGAEPVTLTGHTGAVNSVAFSPDGRLLASGGDDGEVVLWDMAQGTEPVTLTGHTGAVNSVAFSPDGRLLASGGDGGEVVLWDMAQGTELATLTGHTGAVLSVAFSPDGHTLATAGGNDGRVLLRDVARRTRLATLTGHTETVLSVAFSPDGHTLASVGGGQNIILWDVDAASVREQLCAIAGRGLTRDEWAAYLPGRPYRSLCPGPSAAG